VNTSFKIGGKNTNKLGIENGNLKTKKKSERLPLPNHKKSISLLTERPLCQHFSFVSDNSSRLAVFFCIFAIQSEKCICTDTENIDV
jgi:hypothetical protein